jgi:hypothetical protein
MSSPSVRDFDGKPVLGFAPGHKLPVMRDRKEWAAFAFEKASEFVALQNGCSFIAEDLTVWYAEQGYQKAHSDGCWGALWKRLIKNGVIEKVVGERRRKQVTEAVPGRKKGTNAMLVWRAKR